MDHMGRGATTTDSNLDILYGDTRPRLLSSPGSTPLGEQVDKGRVIHAFDVLENTIEYFDQDGQLCLVEVTDPGGYTITNFCEMRRILIEQREPLLEDVLFDAVGTKLYIKDGQLHREAGPAFEGPNGSWAWYHRGYEHRDPDSSGEEKPAVRAPDGSLSWYRYGLRHREDGPAIEYGDGMKSYYQYGKMHRQGGPAMIGSDGYEHWYLYGKRHREDGPAIVARAAGKEKYYLYGQGCQDAKDHKQQKRYHSAKREAKKWKRYVEEQQQRTWEQRLLQGLYEIS